MATIGYLKEVIAGYFVNADGDTVAPAVFIVNGEDLILSALNNVRKAAERAHDFHYSEADVSLQIPLTGAPLASVDGSSRISVTGTLAPNVTGVYTTSTSFGGHPLYVYVLGSEIYLILWNGTRWIILRAATGSTLWNGPTTPSDPSGAYTAQSGATGTATVVADVVSIKRVNFVSLPLTDGTSQPVEMLTNDEFLARVKRQIGRQPYNNLMTLEALGVSSPNPLGYIQANSIFLYPPSQITFPVAASLNVVRFLSEYTTDADTDFFTEFAPDYLQWAAIVELNKFAKTFVPRVEGNLGEDAVQARSDSALAAFIAWDLSISEGTSTPGAAGASAATATPERA